MCFRKILFLFDKVVAMTRSRYSSWSTCRSRFRKTPDCSDEYNEWGIDYFNAQKRFKIQYGGEIFCSYLCGQQNLDFLEQWWLRILELDISWLLPRNKVEEIKIRIELSRWNSPPCWINPWPLSTIRYILLAVISLTLTWIHPFLT